MTYQSYKIGKLLVLFSSMATGVSAQLPDSVLKKIDSVFINCNTSSTGGAIGIIRNDSIIYAKGYGMSNLEYGLFFTTQTIFDIASVSKQFTA